MPPLEDHTQGFAIHIIMEKPTGKTMDCFVEFPSQSAAHQCASRFPQDKGIRLGSRNVYVSMSSQAELMRAIFPRARLVSFDNNTGRPTILQPNVNQDWSQGFRGFVTIEEIHGVVRFAESPSRVSTEQHLCRDTAKIIFLVSVCAQSSSACLRMHDKHPLQVPMGGN